MSLPEPRVYAGPGRVFTDFWACQRQMKKYHGAYPGGFLKRVRENWITGSILHVCSGTVQEEMTVDINAAQEPTVVADGQHLPFRDNCIPNVLIDPPYDEENARRYGFPYPRPYALLSEGVRVTRPGGYVGMLHWLALIRPKDCRRIATIAITIGANMRVRCFSLFQKEATLDFFGGPVSPPVSR